MVHEPYPGPVALARAYLRSDKFQEELRGNWVMAFIHRWPGFLVAAFSIRFGISANAITILGGALALLTPLAAAVLPLTAASWAVCVLGFLVILLDCSDGDVARHSRSDSTLGARLDFAVDMAFWGLLYGALGILADRAGGADIGPWVALSMAAVWGRMLARLYNDNRGGAPTTGSGRWTASGLLVAFFNGLSGAIPFLALAIPSTPWLIWLLAAYAMIDVADSLLRLLGPDGT